MRYWRWLAGCAGAAFGVSAASIASATYSIAATDGATQQVGGAVTSCVGSLDLASVYGSVPGRGVVHAQAQLDTRLVGKTRAIELIRQGVDPRDIIAQLTAMTLDRSFESRQYGIVDIEGRAAGFTGARAQAYKHDQQARVGTFTYSVQGNILTSQRVLDQVAAGFEANGCDLADRLMAALEAGGRNGEGDSRCTGGGIPSDAAFISVDFPGESVGTYLKLSVSDTAPQNPLPMLRALFDTWRKSHPCVAPVVDAGAAADDAGSIGAIDAGTAMTIPIAGVGVTTIAGVSGGSTSGAGGSIRAAGASAIAGAGVGASGISGSVGQMPAAVSGIAGSLAVSPGTGSGDGCSLNAGMQKTYTFEAISLLTVVALYARSCGRRRLRHRP